MKYLLFIAMMSILLVPVTGCDDKGPAEKAGEQIDEAVSDAKDKAGDVADTVSDKADDVAEKAKEEARKAKEAVAGQD